MLVGSRTKLCLDLRSVATPVAASSRPLRLLLATAAGVTIVTIILITESGCALSCTLSCRSHCLSPTRHVNVCTQI